MQALSDIARLISASSVSGFTYHEIPQTARSGRDDPPARPAAAPVTVVRAEPVRPPAPGPLCAPESTAAPRTDRPAPGAADNRQTWTAPQPVPPPSPAPAKDPSEIMIDALFRRLSAEQGKEQRDGTTALGALFARIR